MIVAAYIPTPQGEAALERAVEEARAHATGLVVLNMARGDAVVEQRRLYGEDATALEARLRDTGVEFSIRSEIRAGDTADNLAAIARELDAEMIVIGLRRRSATGKLLFGSTAQRLLLEATCPVLCVKSRT